METDLSSWLRPIIRICLLNICNFPRFAGSSSRKEDIWLLFDNLDKGWPISVATSEDILILKSLLESTRKIEREFQKRGIDFHSIVFIRNDIYQHLIFDPDERGKETPALLEWNDPEVFKEILRRRILSSTSLDLPFDSLWQNFFDSHINGIESFSYILERTLMRPRELLLFTRECINVAVNRGHNKVTQDDILKAEETFSEDLLTDVNFELKDVSPTYVDILYAFIGAKAVLPREEVSKLLIDITLPEAQVDTAISLLLWFGFLGIYLDADEQRYSYQFQHDTKIMAAGIKHISYCIHPGFRKALGCRE